MALDRALKGRNLRAAAILSVAELLAVRGYPDAALTYTGVAQRVAGEQATAWLRFRRLMICEAVSYLRGAASIEETRKWHTALVKHLNDHGASQTADPLAVAHAIMKTEHAAWTAGVASGATVEELLEPLAGSLPAALAEVSEENRQRFRIEQASLAACWAAPPLTRRPQRSPSQHTTKPGGSAATTSGTAPNRSRWLAGTTVVTLGSRANGADKQR